MIFAPKENPLTSPVPESVRRYSVRLSSMGLGLCVVGIVLGVLLQKAQVRGQWGAILALVSSMLGTWCLFNLLIERRPRDRSGASPPAPEGEAGERRRRNLRNYGASFVACGVGVLAGLLLQRSGWGNSFGNNVAVLSGLLGLFCGGAFLRALKG